MLNQINAAAATVAVANARDLILINACKSQVEPFSKTNFNLASVPMDIMAMLAHVWSNVQMVSMAMKKVHTFSKRGKNICENVSLCNLWMQATVVGTSFRQVTPQIAISLHFPQPLRAMLVSSHSKENHPKKLKSGTSVLKWRKITIFLHFAATIEVVVICSHPPNSFFRGLIALLCIHF